MGMLRLIYSNPILIDIFNKWHNKILDGTISIREFIDLETTNTMKDSEEEENQKYSINNEDSMDKDTIYNTKESPDLDNNDTETEKQILSENKDISDDDEIKN